MRKYETIIILDPDLKDQARTELFDKVKNIISKESGILLDFDEWGNKKLAYAIKKKLRGSYVCITYGGTGALVKELERNLRLSDEVLKFMTLLLLDNVTVEQLELEAKENQEAASDTVEEKPAEEKTDSNDTSEDDNTVKETTQETEMIKE